MKIVVDYGLSEVYTLPGGDEMGNSTFDIIKQYCDQKFTNEIQRGKVYSSLARRELLDEESRLGKKFIQFSADEIEHYLFSISNTIYYKGDNIRPSQSYIRFLVSYYRDFFRYYNTIAEAPIINPMDDKRFRFIGSRVKNDLPIFTRETLEKICLSIDEHDELFVKGDAEFTQLILWLFYSGCLDAGDIIELKEKDVNLQMKTAKLQGGRTIHLPDPCVELLKKNHMIPEFESYRFTNLMIPYHDSYVWFPYRMKKTPDGSDPYDYAFQQQQERQLTRVKGSISVRLSKIRDGLNVFVKPTLLYYRGIYDYIVSRCGEERTRELLTTENGRSNMANVEEFNRYVDEYGARLSNRSELYIIKGNLKAFLP